MSDSLDKLFQEKRDRKPKPHVVDKLPKKVKKKDIPMVSIEERELQFYEYALVQGIKIYNGILIKDKEEMINNIEFYKMISQHDIFTPLCPSTLTARGEFSNINFNEEDFIKTIPIPSKEYASILKIGCNFGEIFIFPNPHVHHPIGVMVKAIVSLHDIGTIKIGCSCNPLLDTNAIFELAMLVLNDCDKFEKIMTTYVNGKILSDKTYNKKKATKILKNFNVIQKFQKLEDDDIQELFDVMQTYISDQNSLRIVTNYLENINKIVNYFVEYEK